MTTPYPEIAPYRRGLLPVGDGQEVYWEACGDPAGKPALVLHGGPGSGCSAWHRRLFDPSRYDVFLLDQRNCGRSRPHASVADIDLTSNTTHHLVADIELLRRCASVERWMVVGGSWGCALALAYAEAHPSRVSELVLFGVTAGLRREFDRVFRGGLAEEFPAAWARLRQAVLRDSQRDVDVVDATFELLFHSDAAVRARAAYEWCLWESAIPAWPRQMELEPRFRDPAYALAFARIVTHYVRHDAWLEDGALFDGLDAIANVPAVLIDGRHDPQTAATAQMLTDRMPRARHVIVGDAAHAANDAIASEIVAATQRFVDG